jgi:Raf kinase inhibitor-like YbhB/YbcL family protein
MCGRIGLGIHGTSGGLGQRRDGCAAMALYVAAVIVSGCGQLDPPPNTEGGATVKLSITSTAFDNGQPIPRKLSGEGQDISPPLAWDAPPAGTQELALICDDPKAPTPQPWVHWVIYAIPADVRSLPAAIPNEPELKEPVVARQGKNSWDKGVTIGYRGPMPPEGHGMHLYHFQLYALDAKLDLKPGATKDQLLKAMKGHVLADGKLVGTYER